MLTILLILTGIFGVVYSCVVAVLIAAGIEDKVNYRKDKKLIKLYGYEKWLSQLGLRETRSIVESIRPKHSYFFNEVFDKMDGIFFGWR